MTMATDKFFSLKLCKNEDDNCLYLDLPASKCEEGTELIGYEVLHGGDNQQWKWDNEQLTSLILYPSYCLGVKVISDLCSVTLCCNNEGDSVAHTKWLYNDGAFFLKEDCKYCLGVFEGKIVTCDIAVHGVTTWEMECCESSAKPATSCHLRYGPIPELVNFESWTLENTVCVRASTYTTYFCIVGWGPGGYSGVQQIGEDKIAIFSMWNIKEHKVRALDIGDGVEVSEFGAEGTGLKAMKKINWYIGDKITFKVRGERCVCEGLVSWKCSGWISINGMDWELMACYERSGCDRPFDGHFYSFIEDWNRQNDAKGHNELRMAEFQNAKLTLNENVFQFKQARFTKQRHGADKFGKEKAFGGIQKSSLSFVLATGGSSLESIQGQFFIDKYEECTNEHNKLLSLQ